MSTWIKRISVAECRAMGRHPSQRTRAFAYDQGEIYASWFCIRCGTRIYRWYSFLTGEFTSAPVYQHPADYPHFKKGKVPKPRELRSDFFRTLRKQGKLTAVPKDKRIEHRAYKQRRRKRGNT